LVERTTLLTESQDEIGERLAAEAALHGWPPNAGGWELQDALLQLNILQTVVFSDHKNTDLPTRKGDGGQRSVQGAIAWPRG
jgi:hypothetical protein